MKKKENRRKDYFFLFLLMIIGVAIRIVLSNIKDGTENSDTSGANDVTDCSSLKQYLTFQ